LRTFDLDIGDGLVHVADRFIDRTLLRRF